MRSPENREDFENAIFFFFSTHKIFRIAKDKVRSEHMDVPEQKPLWSTTTNNGPTITD